MAIDPYMIGTAVFGVASAVCGIGWIGAARAATDGWALVDRIQADAQVLSSEYLAAKSRLVKLEREEQRRHDHLKAIASKGSAAANAVKRQKRAAAAAMTMTALTDTSFRSRAQVVAPVKAKRTRAKKAETV